MTIIEDNKPPAAIFDAEGLKDSAIYYDNS